LEIGFVLFYLCENLLRSESHAIHIVARSDC